MLLAAAIFGVTLLPRPAARAQSSGGTLLISGGSLAYTGSSSITLGGTPTFSSTLTLLGGGTVTVFGGGTITLMPMPGYTGNLTHQHFFATEQYVGNGVFYMALPNGSPFGYYSFLGPYLISLDGSKSGGGWIYHFDLGYEYVVDPNDGHNGVYLYDYKTGDYFYTSPTFPFPYLYDLTLNAVLYYYPDPSNPGRYNTNGTRYFYNFATGQVITK